MLLTQEEVAEIRAHHANGTKQVRLAQIYGVSPHIIGQIVHKTDYKPRNAYWTEQARRSHRQRKCAQRDTGLNARLTRDQVVDIKTRLAGGERGEKIAQEYGVSKSTISLIRKGKRWKDVEVQAG
jgi:transposase